MKGVKRVLFRALVGGATGALLFMVFGALPMGILQGVWERMGWATWTAASIEEFNAAFARGAFMGCFFGAWAACFLPRDEE